MIKAKKHLGQNFLKNIHILDSIIGDESLVHYDIVEIGPGPGDLTSRILEKHPKSLHVIEIDHDMIPLLKERFWDSITIHHADVLKTNITQNKELKGIYLPKNYKVYGNIPYYITSPILMHFLYDIQAMPDDITITMQKEVADRILAYNKKHSVLSLACQLVSHITKVCDIHPNNFSPPPKVWSTCLRFRPLSCDKETNKKTLFLIKQGFAQKRKKLFSNLVHTDYSPEKIEKVFEKANISSNARAEDLSIEQWKCLAEWLL